jgi:hypothetical protein
MELFSQLHHVGRQYEAISLLPHEPPMSGVYYRGQLSDGGDGRYLNQFVDLFRPATPLDRILITAAVLTTVWGGPAGMRPAFVITSDDGRGVGKTKLAVLIAHIVGGALDVDAGCDVSALKERLLSPEGQTKRVAILDNVKSLKFSWAELEKLITAANISGKQLYVGEAQRPNYLTWFLTLNGVALGDDMAQRSVIIKIVRGQNSGTWWDDAMAFVDQHRDRIIADAVAALRADREPLLRPSRWASWEHDVLSRLLQPNEVQALILERQSEANCELDEADLIEEFFAEQLRGRGFDLARNIVHIPSAIAGEWYCRATGEKIKTVGASKRLSQLAAERANQSDAGKFKHIRVNPSRTRSRGFLWWGDDASPDMPTDYSLSESSQGRAA